MPKAKPNAIAVLLVALIPLWAAAPLALADRADWKATATLSDEKTNTIDTTGSKTLETVDRTFELTYADKLTKTLDFNANFKLGINDSIGLRNSSFDSRQTTPNVDMTLKAPQWALNGTWNQTIGWSDDPASPGVTTTNYTGEVKIDPKFDKLPTFNFKWTGGDASIARAYDTVLDYKLMRDITLNISAKKDTTDERDPKAADTDNRTFNTSLGWSRALTQNLKSDVKWTMDRTQSLSIDDFGLLTQKADTLDNDVDLKLAHTAFSWLTSDIEKTIHWAKDLQTNKDTVRDDKWLCDVKANPKVTKDITVTTSYTDTRSKNTGTDAPTSIWSQAYSYATDYTPFDLLALKGSWDRKDDLTLPLSAHTTEKSKDTRNDAYKFSAETKFFRNQVDLKVSRDLTYNWDGASKTTWTRNWQVDGNINLNKLPRFTIVPTMTFTENQDVIQTTTTYDRDLKVEFKYPFVLGSTKFDIDHTYDRKSTFPDKDPNFLTRTDTTKLTYTMTEFLKGMTTSLDWSRNATDTSGDDKKPDVTYTNSFKYDWSILKNYKTSITYEHDYSHNNDAKEKFLGQFTMKTWKDKIEIKWEYEHQNSLQGPRAELYRYLVEVNGTF